MLRIDAFVRRRRRLVVGAWLAALVAAVPFAAQQSDRLTGGGFSAPGSQSVDVAKAVAARFPSVRSETLAVILVPHGGARPGDVERALREVRRELRGEGVSVGRGGGDPRRALVAPLAVASRQTTIDVAKRLRPKLGIAAGRPGPAAGGRVDVHLGGQGALWAAFQAASETAVKSAESRGLPIVAIVLLAAFGSLAAVALPLGLGIAAVVVTGAVVYALSLATEMSIFVTNMTSMLGIGVAVDYSLFVLARYREEIRAGREPGRARAAALATSGLAVVFSGLTVMASLAGLFLTGSQALGSMATGAIVVVAMSMLAAATLLPALISLLGRRAHERGRLTRRPRSRRGLWERWAETVMRHPVRTLLAATCLLLALAAPAVKLHMANSALRQVPASDESRTAIAAAASSVGPGALGPALVLVDFARGGRPRAATLDRLQTALRRDPEVAAATPVATSDDGRAVLLAAPFRSDPESDAARAAVPRLRARLRSVADGSAEVAVGGTTATILDFDKLVSSSLWKLILFVLALSFAVLVVLLRSVVLPIKAVLMNVLSVAAAYGVLVAVFQWGWLSFVGLAKTPAIDTITPPLVLAVAFGLSMDYEVFLLSRIRERYAVSGDNRRAVTEGLAGSAHTITSAAVIMVAVFLAFVSAGLPSVQRLGVAAAVAIAVDATIVRLVIVPAAMVLLGDWNWWLPRPLARVLPRVEVERLADGAVRSAAR